MPKFFSKYKKLILSLILILLISSLGIFALGVGEAKAGILDLFKDPKEFVISLASTALYYLVFRPFSLLLSISGFLLDWAFGLESFLDVPIVQEGWKVVRDLSNMFFVLILLIIAFATILRVETYGMKALLPKLIIAALLINFSLVFCGVIIDFTQVFARFFLDPLEATGASLSENIANGLNIMKMFEQGEAAGIDALNILIGIMGGIVVILVMAFTMAVGAFFLIVRVVALWLLIVLAPIAWLLWILPATRNLWNQWWQSFLKWALFAPIYAFFFYLTVITIIGSGGSGGFLSNVLSTVPLGENEGWINAFFSSQQLILQYIFLVVLLLASLVVAQKTGVHGAQGAIKIAQGAGKGTAKWAGRRAQMAATKPVGGRIGAAGDKLLRGLEKVPLLRQATRPTRAFTEKERVDMAKSEKKYKDRTSNNLKLDFKSANTRDKAAITKILADRGDFKADDKLGFGKEEIEKAIKLSKRYEQEGNILKARPDLAPLVGKDINKVVAGIKPKDIEKFQIEAIGEVGKEQTKEQKEVQEAIKNQFTTAEGKWNKSIVVKIAEANPVLNIKIRKDVIEPNLNDVHKELKEYMRTEAGKAITEGEKITTSATEAAFQETKKTGYKGK